jgi:glucosylglycerate synthase
VENATLEVEPISQPPAPKVEPVKSADLVLGVVAEIDDESLITLCDSLRTLPGSPIIAALRNAHVGGAAGATSEASEKVPSPYFVPWPSSKTDDPGTPVVNVATAYQSAFAVSEQLNARACCIVASTIENAKPDWIRELVRPLLEEDFDLVAPQYALRKFEGLLNSSVISPLTRCLYGKRIRNPMGPDLGISRRLFTKLASEKTGGVGNGVHLVASIAPGALCDNLKVCQVLVGPRTYPPPDWTNISSLVSQILSPIFADMEKRAACWQRTRSSVPLPSFGKPVLLSQDTGTVDVSRMVESFQLGNRDLQEIWDLVLPPSTLLELRKLARLPLEQFRMPNDLWVRIVYDFALAHRLRTINRDHLLKSMTPLYLAWVAGFARDAEAADAAGVEQILERLAVAYESAKPYLVSRWRWPDRFNP